MSEIKALLDRVIADGVLTEDEHEELIEAMYGDGELDETESQEIARLFQMIKDGKLTIVNKSRDGGS
ncbi:hypothetical protein JNK13_08125 [bacterium]|nr:hypothetical protein [bacterium]